MSTKRRAAPMTHPTSGAQAYAELLGEIAAVDDAQLVAINRDIGFAHQIALGAAERIEELMPQLEALPTFDIDRVRRLPVYAAACQHAHLLATTPEPSDTRLPRLLEQCTRLRADLLSTAALLVRFGDLSAERVAAIRTGSRHTDIASGVEQLALLFAGIPDRVASRVPLIADLLDRAPALASELHTLLGAKATRPATIRTEAQRMRQRAFSLLVQVYEECRVAVAFIRRREGDAEQFTPSLFTRKRSMASSRAEAKQTEALLSIADSAPIALAPTG